MNWSSKALFAYCLIASLFLTISGIGVLMQSGSPAPLLLSLPVSGYFVYFAMRTLISKKALPQGPSSPHADRIITIVFIALISGAVYTIASPRPTPSKSLQPVILPTPSPSQAPVLRGTIKDDITGPVRIRAEANLTSDIVDTTKANVTFVVISTQKGWVHVQLPNMKSGWIKEEFILVSPTPTK